MRKRVLIIAHNHPAVRPGGAETYAHELHCALRGRDDWDPTFVARSGPPHAPDLQPHAGMLSPRSEDEYLLYPQGDDYDWLFGTMRERKSLYTRRLRELLLEVRPDVVHFQHTLFIGYDAIREVRETLPDAAIAYTLHEFLPICHHKGQMVRTRSHELCDRASPRRCHDCFPDIPPRKFVLRERFIKSQFAHVDLFVAPSATVRERFIDWGLPAERVLLEDYGRAGLDDRPRQTRPAPHSRFGYFGQLTPFKGVDVLIQAIEAARTSPEPLLWIHGANLDLAEPRFRKRLEELIRRSGDRVKLAGPYSPVELDELMADVDWVVVPSLWWENSPLVIQEAFARGKPVICSDVGGMAEKVDHGVSGLHFARGDAESLARTIERAVREPNLWERLAAGAPRIPPMARHVDVLTDAYTRLIRSRSAVAA